MAAEQKDHQSESPPAAGAAPKRRRRLRRLVIVLVALVMVLAVLVALAPTILSTGWGKQRIVGLVNGRIPGTVQIESLDLNWFGGQAVDKFVLLDIEGRSALSVDHLATEAGLWHLLWGGRDLGETQIDALDADIVFDEEYQTNLAQALGLSDEPDEEPGTPVRGAIVLAGGQVKVTMPKRQPVLLTDLAAEAQLGADDQPTKFDLSCQSRQGDLAGTVKASGTVETSGGGEMIVNSRVDITGLPTDGLEALLAAQSAQWQGLLRTWLGEQIDLTADIKSKTDGPGTDMHLAVRCEGLTTNISGELTDKHVALTKPARIPFTLTTGLTRRIAELAADNPSLAPVADMQLEADAPVELVVNRLVVALPQTAPDGTRTFDVAGVSVNVALAADRLALAGQEPGDALIVEKLDVTLDTTDPTEALAIHVAGQAEQASRRGTVSIDAELTDPLASSGRFQTEHVEINGVAHFKDMPAKLVDRLAAMDGFLVDLLGERFDLDATFSTEDKQTDVKLTVNCDNAVEKLVLPLVIGSTNVSLSAAGPDAGGVAARWRVTPGLFARFVPDDSLIRLDKPTVATIALRRLQLPRPRENERMHPKDIQLDASLSVEPVALKDVPQLGDIDVRSASVTVSGRSLDDAHVEAKADALLHDASTRLATLAGKAISLTAEVDPKFNAEGGFDGAVIDARLTGRQTALDATARGQLDANNTFTLLEPAKAQLTVTPQMLAALELVKPGAPTIAGPTPVRLTIAELRAPLKDFALTKVTAQLVAELAKLELAGDKRLSGAALHNTKATVQFNGPAESVTLNLAGKASAPGQQKPESMLVDATITELFNDQHQFDRDAATVKARKIVFGGLPTAFLETVAGRQGQLTPLLGDRVHVDATANLIGLATPRGTVDAKIASPLLQADAGLKLTEYVQATRPITFAWTVTPQGYQALRKLTAGSDAAAANQPPPLTLEDRFTVRGQIDSLRWPMPAAKDTSARIDPAKAAVIGQFSASTVTLTEGSTKATYVLSGLTGSVRADNLAKPISFAAEGQVVRRGADPAESPGKIALIGTLADVLLPNGKLNRRGLSLTLNGQLEKVPVAWIDEATGSDGLLTAALGRQISGTVETQLKRMAGPVKLSAQSANAAADIDAVITEDGYLTLTDTSTAQLIITEQLSRRLINHPLLKQALKSDGPVTVVVHHAARFGEQVVPFRLPMFGDETIKDERARRNDFFARMDIPLMTVSPGRMTMRNAGLIKTLTGLPEAVGSLSRASLGDLKNRLDGDELPAWFTPVDITVRRGVMTYSRMDTLLGENYQVATWGTLDLVNRRGRMVLGLAERTMRRVYGIPSFRDNPDYVDQFVMEGSLAQLSPDQGEMTARLLALTGGGVAGQIGGEELGGLVGDIIKVAGEAHKAVDPKRRKQASTPPARKPFPWPEEEKPAEPAEAQTPEKPEADQQQLKDQPEQPPAEKRTVEDELEDLGKDLLQDLLK